MSISSTSDDATDGSYVFCDSVSSSSSDSPSPKSLPIRFGQIGFWGSVFTGTGYYASSLCKKKPPVYTDLTSSDAPEFWTLLDFQDRAPSITDNSRQLQAQFETPLLLDNSRPPTPLRDCPQTLRLTSCEQSLSLNQSPRLELADIGDAQRKNIENLIDTLAPCTGLKGGVILGAKYGYLKGLKKALDPLHPFQFLGTIFGTPALKEKMPSIFLDKTPKILFIDVSYEKQKGFCGGVKEGMERELKRNNIEPHIHSFCRRVGTTPEKVRSFIDYNVIARSNWHGLVEHLIEVPLPPSSMS